MPVLFVTSALFVLAVLAAPMLFAITRALMGPNRPAFVRRFFPKG